MGIQAEKVVWITCDEMSCGAAQQFIIPRDCQSLAAARTELRERGWTFARYPGGTTVRCRYHAHGQYLTTRKLGLTE